MNESSQDQNNCSKLEELILPRNRVILGRVARDYLDGRFITPSELLFWAPYGRHFHDAGTTLAACVQKVAIAQVQATKRPVGERIKELFALSEQVIGWADTLGKKLPPPPLSGAALSTIASALHDDGPHCAVAAIARHSEGATSWLQKIEKWMQLADEQTSPKALGIIDDMIAEVLASEAAVTAITGGADTAGKRIQALLALSAGEPEFQSGITLAPELARLQHAIVSGHMPESRAACRARITSALVGPQRMASKAPFEEFNGLASMAGMLRKAVSLGGTVDFAEAIEKRMVRTVTAENFAAFTEGLSGFGQKILRVIWILDRTTGSGPRHELMKYLAHLIQHRDLEAQFSPPNMPQPERQALAEAVLKAVTSNSMADNRREALLNVLKPVVQRLLGSDRRAISRRNTGPDDHVILNDVRLQLRNWSPSGLLFGPMSNPPQIGAKVMVTVTVMHKKGRIHFEAEAEVLRIVNGEIGARYTCRNPAVLAEIQAYFAT